jgi:uncharacterized delta-60 repeat protein
MRRNGVTRSILTIVLAALLLSAPLAALAAPGDLDTTFSGDGMRAIGFGPDSDRAHDILVLPSGKILVGGVIRVGGESRFGLVRLTANGAFDTTFGGGDGKATGPAGTIWGLARTTDGKVLAVGDSPGAPLQVARFTAAGALDTTFGGGDGVVLTGFGPGTTSTGYDLAVLADGRFLVAGETWDGSQYDLIVARYNPIGGLDTTFGGGDGKVRVDVAGGTDGAFDVMPLSSGDFLVGGWAGAADGSEDLAVLRFTADGSLKPAFGGGDGIATANFGSGSDGGIALVRMGNGTIVIAGHALVGADYDLVLARFTPTGVLDTTFGGGDGKARLARAGNQFAGDLALVGGRLYLSGTIDDNLSLVRFTTAGAVDSTFGTGGVASADFGFPSQGHNGGIAVQANGKLVVASSSQGDNPGWAVARFLRS